MLDGVWLKVCTSTHTHTRQSQPHVHEPTNANEMNVCERCDKWLLPYLLYFTSLILQKYLMKMSWCRQRVKVHLYIHLRLIKLLALKSYFLNSIIFRRFVFHFFSFLFFLSFFFFDLIILLWKFIFPYETHSRNSLLSLLTHLMLVALIIFDCSNYRICMRLQEKKWKK